MYLKFRHVAHLPKWNSQTCVHNFQAILIDLTRAESELDPQIARLRAVEGLATLAIELDQIKNSN